MSEKSNTIVRPTAVGKTCFCGNDKFRVYKDPDRLFTFVCIKCTCTRVVTGSGKEVSIPFGGESNG